MDVAAGTIGVVGFAIASTKSIYQIISGIRNAPENVARAARSLDEMAQTLQRIQDLGYSTGQHPDLLRMIQDYQSAITEFREKVEKVQCLPTDSRTQRFWRQVRTHLKETDLERIHRLVQEQLGRLSVQFNIIAAGQGDAQMQLMSSLTTISDAQNHHTQLLSTLDDQAKSQLNKVGTVNAHIKDLVTSTNDFHATAHLNSRNLLRKIGDTSQKATDLSNMSKDQHGELVSKLNVLTHMVHALHLDRPAASQRDQGVLEDIPQRAAPIDVNVGESIARISSHLEAIDLSLYNEKAESLLQDLDGIIQLLAESTTKIHRSKNALDFRNQKDFGLLRRRLATSSLAVVNGKGLYQNGLSTPTNSV